MLTLPASVRVLLATEPVDMRKSIDGLMALVRTSWTRLRPCLREQKWTHFRAWGKDAVEPRQVSR